MYSIIILFNDTNNTVNILFKLMMIIHIKCTLLLFYYLTTYLHYLNNFIFCNRKNLIKARFK